MENCRNACFGIYLVRTTKTEIIKLSFLNTMQLLSIILTNKYYMLQFNLAIIAWLMLAGVSNMAYFADENQNHYNSGRFKTIFY